MQQFHLTHPRLDFWVTVEIWERDGRYMATADLAEGTRDIGTGDTPRQAVVAAVMALSEPHASEMAVGVSDEHREPAP